MKRLAVRVFFGSKTASFAEMIPDLVEKIQNDTMTQTDYFAARVAALG